MPGNKFLEHQVVRYSQAIGGNEAGRERSSNDSSFRGANLLHQDVGISFGCVRVGARCTHAMARAEFRESSLVDACAAILLGCAPPACKVRVPRQRFAGEFEPTERTYGSELRLELDVAVRAPELHTQTVGLKLHLQTQRLCADGERPEVRNQTELGHTIPWRLLCGRSDTRRLK